MASPEIRKVAFLGLGIMGRPMAANIARAGFELRAWTRTREKALAFGDEHGLSTSDTPAGAAAGADAVITMVTDAPQVESVLFAEGGAANELRKGALVIDMSTIAPTAARAIGERLAESGIAFLEAPVSGSRPKAEDGTLTIMAGGKQADFERARTLLDAMGGLVVHVGPQGHGQMAKVLSNTMGAVNAAVLGEALTVARRAGLDMDAFLEVAAASAGDSVQLELKARPMLEGDFEPLFKLDHMLKDVRHCLAEADALGLKPTLGGVAERLYSQAAADGLGERDFAAIVSVVR